MRDLAPLNTRLLTETQYVELIQKTIADVCKEYEGQSEVDEILLWDVIKMKIREASLCYAAARKRRLENRENRLEAGPSTTFEIAVHDSPLKAAV